MPELVRSTLGHQNTQPTVLLSAIQNIVSCEHCSELLAIILGSQANAVNTLSSGKFRATLLQCTSPESKTRALLVLASLPIQIVTVFPQLALPFDGDLVALPGTSATLLLELLATTCKENSRPQLRLVFLLSATQYKTTHL